MRTSSRRSVYTRSPMASLVDLTQLRTFVAVAEEGHLTRAAERIHISQSAASAHIRAVEELLDTQLFARTNRNLELTRAGELLLVKSKALLNEAMQLAAYARQLSGKLEGSLIISVSSEPSGSRIGEMVANLRASHPLVRFDVRARPSAGIRQGLKNGELDIGILLDRPTDHSLTYYQLNTVEFNVVGPVGWKETIERAGLEELAKLPWLTPAGNSMAYTGMLSDIFEKNGFQLNSVTTFDNAVIARSMLSAGIGMMLMRKEHAEDCVRNGTCAMSPLIASSHGNFLAHLKSRREDPLILACLQAASTVWPEVFQPSGPGQDG